MDIVDNLLEVLDWIREERMPDKIAVCCWNHSLQVERPFWHWANDHKAPKIFTYHFLCAQSLYIKRGKLSVRTYVTYVRNAGRGQLSSENDVIMRIFLPRELC